MFNLVSKFSPAGDQPKAIEYITQGIKDGKKFHKVDLSTGELFVYEFTKDLNFDDIEMTGLTEYM